MSRNPVSFSVTGSDEVYRSKWLSVELLQVMRGDTPSDYNMVVNHGSGSAVIIRDEDYNFLLLKIYRFTIGATNYEFAAGGLDKGESPADAAVRETLEEAGIEIRDLKHIVDFKQIPGMINFDVHLFEAVVPHDALVAATQHDTFSDEVVERRIFSLAQIREAIVSGEIAGGIELAAFGAYIYDLPQNRLEELRHGKAEAVSDLPMPVQNPMKFEVLKRTNGYTTPWLEVDELEIMRDGIPGEYSVAKRPTDAIAAIIRDEKERFLMLSVYRFPTQQERLELVMGGVDKGEPPEDAARREVFEETGIEPTQFNHVLTFYGKLGLTSQKFFVYDAVVASEQLEQALQSEKFDDEIMERKILTWDEMGAAIKSGGFTESVSMGCVALYKLLVE